MSFASAIALNRFGLGARPGEMARMDDPRQWLRAQLTGPAPLLSGPELRPTREIMAGASQPLAASYRPVYLAEAQARLLQAVSTDRPFLERLVHFWSNHFAVSVDKGITLGIAGSMEREAIRPHVLGRFRDLLRAAEHHPAMLLFLDNQGSTGPDSRFARMSASRGKRAAGLNENLAREVLELHTLGVDGGYSQQDVTSFARVLTGWSVNGPRGAPQRTRVRGLFRRRFPAPPVDAGSPGEFVFREGLHEPGAQTLMGQRYAQAGEAQGLAVLDDLARDPATARHISSKLARHFIADEPPPAVVNRMARAWQESDGDLPTVCRTMVDSPEAWESPLAKYKTPTDYIVSAWRGLALPVPEAPRSLGAFELLGQRQFSPGSPAGWPDRSADWDGASALMKRIEFAETLGRRIGSRQDAAALAPQLMGASLSEATARSVARAASAEQALTLMLASPEFLRR